MDWRQQARDRIADELIVESINLALAWLAIALATYALLRMSRKEIH